MHLIISKLLYAVFVIVIMTSVNTLHATPLGCSQQLSIDEASVFDSTGKCLTGSCFGMEVSPGFWLWVNLSPGYDEGIIVDKNQLSGGQDLFPDATNNTSGDMTAAWTFFGNYGTLFADNRLNVFSDTSNDGITELNDFNVAWNGSSIPMGGGVINDYTIERDILNQYSIDYTQVVPDGHPSGFGGVKFWLLARGSVSVFSQCPNPPVVNNVYIEAGSGEITRWTPDYSDDAGDIHSCEITANASYGNVTVEPDCSIGSYTSGVGYEGQDSFSYRVTDQNGLSGTANGIVEVVPILLPVCSGIYSLKQVLTVGGAQGPSVNSTLTVGFTGHITTEAGLTSGGKNTVKICPDTTVEYNAISTTGTARCTINNSATASTGTLAIGDKLICTNKSEGDDTDRFSIKSGY